MQDVLRRQKRLKIFWLLFLLIFNIGVYSFIKYSEDLIGIKIELTNSMILLYIVVLVFSDILVSVQTSNRIEKAAQINHLSISHLIGADISEAYDFGQIAIMSYDQSKRIVWYSDLLEKRKLAYLGQKISDFSVTLNTFFENPKENELLITKFDRKYSVIHLDELSAFVFKDVTDLDNLLKNREERSPIIGSLLIDNLYDMNKVGDNAFVEIEAAIRREITEWAKKNNLLLYKFKDDGYTFYAQESDYEKIVADNFKILEDVRKIKKSDDTNLTLSIGIGRGSYDIKKISEAASNALDVALSRGGDQVVVNNFGSNLEFYGGKILSKARKSSVKSRVLAQSLQAHLGTAKNIYVMGHTLLDMDALGACLGIYALAESLEKQVKIIWDDKLIETKTKTACKLTFDKAAFNEMFILPNVAEKEIEPESLLVVVDCHRPVITMAPTLLKKAQKVALIDHHRLAEDVIDSPVFSYVEPTASSAVELICELLKFSNNKVVVKDTFATIMLSGILLDTNYYRLRTNARTFEISMMLKEYGASTEQADEFLKDDYEEYTLKTKIMSNTETPYYGMILAVADKDDVMERALLAKVAQEALSLKEIRAVFVIGAISTKSIGISARSDGSVNVQLLMEKMGGGGHFNAAATQVDNKKIDEVRTDFLKMLALYHNDITLKKGE